MPITQRVDWELPLMIIKVKIENRSDGAVNVSSPNLPGFNLSGHDKTKIIAAIEPAVRALLRHKGKEPRHIWIDAEIINAPTKD